VEQWIGMLPGMPEKVTAVELSSKSGILKK
jgi:hypothetical protein